LDPDEAPQNVGPHLGSQLLETRIIYEQNIGLKQRIFAIFEINKKRNKNNFTYLDYNVFTCLLQIH